MNKLIKNTALIVLLVASGLCAMENKQLFELAYQCDAEKLEKLITPENINTCDKYGTSLFMHAITGAFEHQRFDDFEKTFLVFKKHNFNCNASVQEKTDFTHFCYLANLSIDFWNLTPLQIVLKHGTSPFENDLSVFVQMQVFAKNGIPFASNVAQEMVLAARNIHDAAKAVSVSAISKYINKESVNSVDNKNNRPLTYVIDYATYAQKKDLLAAIKLLKDHGADLNGAIAHYAEIPGYTYMHYATTISCENHNLSIAEAMLENGGSPLAGIGHFPLAPIQFVEFMARKEPFYKQVLKLYSDHLKDNE